MRNAALPFLFLISLFLSACAEVNSPFPLSQPGEQANDKRLPGVWTYHEKDSPIFLHISEEKEGWLEGVIVGPKGGPGPGLITFQALTTQIGENNFVNIRNYREFKKSATGPPEKPVPEEGRYWIVLYEISEEGRLFLRMMNPDYVKANAEAGRIQGTLEEKDDWHVSFIITDDLENLVRFITDSDMDKLFPASLQIPEKNSFFQKLTVPSPPKSE